MLRLLNGCPVGVEIFSEDLERRLYANPAIATMFGVESTESLLLLNVDDSWCDTERLEQMKDYIRSGNEIKNFVAKRRRVDGPIFWVTMNSQVSEVDGRNARIFWVTEVTDLVAALKDTNTTSQSISA